MVECKLTFSCERLQ